jgi:hypothetical protein
MKIIKLTEAQLSNMIKNNFNKSFKKNMSFEDLIKEKTPFLTTTIEEYLMSSSPKNWEDEFDYATDVINEITDIFIFEFDEMGKYYDELVEYIKMNYSDDIFEYYSNNGDKANLKENKIMNENYYEPDKLYDKEYVISILKKAPRHLKSLLNKLDDIPCKNSKGESRRCTKIPAVLHAYMWDR